MSQTPTRARNLGLAALLLTGIVFSGAAHAQSARFTYNAPDGSGSHDYGLLNGQQVALYINDRGDLGAPYQISNGNPGIKPFGIIDPITGRPNPGNIASTGQVLPLTDPRTYGALFSQTPTGGGAIGDSVKLKSEYITGGGRNAIEGFSIYANDGLQQLPNRFLRNSDLDFGSFIVNPAATASDPLSAVSNLSAELSFASGNSGVLNIAQNVNFQGANTPTNRVQFSTNFTNNSDDPLQNFRYARVLDANTGFSSANTSQSFFSPTDPEAFALTSTVGSNAIGIGVFDGVIPGSAPGSILFVADSSFGEGTLLQSPFDRATTYIELLGNNGAALKTKIGNDLDTTNDSIIASTLNFIGDLAFRDLVGTTLGFGNSRDSSLVLLSPSLTIAPGQTANFTFYLFFGGQVTSPVPEPGTVALFAAGGFSGLWLRRRKVSRR